MANGFDPNKTAKAQSAAAVGTGAFKGAATGAAIGSIGGPIGTAIGGGIGAIGGAISGGIGSKRNSAKKAADDMLMQEFRKAQQGKLGIGASERDQLIADETAAGGARVQMQQALLARQNLAGGMGFSGQQAQQQRDLAATEGQIAAQASRSVNEASRAQEQARNTALQQRMGERAAEFSAQAQQNQQTFDQGLQGAGTLAAGLSAGAQEDALLSELGLGNLATMSDEQKQQVAAIMGTEFGSEVNNLIGWDFVAPADTVAVDRF